MDSFRFKYIADHIDVLHSGLTFIISTDKRKLCRVRQINCNAQEDMAEMAGSCAKNAIADLFVRVKKVEKQRTTWQRTLEERKEVDWRSRVEVRDLTKNIKKEKYCGDPVLPNGEDPSRGN